MRVSVIVAHPDRGSFNHAIARACVAELGKRGHDVAFHDLYEEEFNPLLPRDEIPKEAVLAPELARHCEEISSAGGIIIVHPNWWGQPPAILKGWVDRVLRPGVAYEFLEGAEGEGVPIGLLKARVALVFNTSNTPPERERTVFGDPLETLWWDCVFGLCGVETFYRRMFCVMVTSTLAQRREWLEEVRRVVSRYF